MGLPSEFPPRHLSVLPKGVMRLTRRTRMLACAAGALMVVAAAEHGLELRSASLRASTTRYWNGLLASGARQTTRVVDTWLQERRADAVSAAHASRDELLALPHAAAGAPRVSQTLYAAVESGELDAAWLVARDGALLATALPALPPTPDELAALRATAVDGQGRVVGPARVAGGPVSISFVEPVRGGDDARPGAPLGAVAVRAEMEGSLFTLVGWKLGPSQTGQTRLLARAGGEVVVVGPSQHPRAGPMELRMPLGAQPAAVREALDARDTGSHAGDDGNLIVAASRVPTTGWAVARSISRGEALQSTVTQLRLEALLTILFLACLVLGTAAGSRHGRTRALARVTESRARLAEAQEIAHLGSWGWVVPTREAEWSSEMFNILGLPPRGAPPGLDELHRFVHPDDVNAVQAMLAGIIGGGQPAQLEFRIVRADGAVRHVHARGQAVAKNGTTHLVGTVQDVTDHRRAEEALRASQERLNLALAGGRVAMWDMDMVSGHVHSSDGWEAVLGYAEAERGTSFDWWMSRVHPDEAPALQAAILGHLRAELAEIDVVFRMLTPVGAWKWIHARARAGTRDRAGRALRVTGTASDITERTELEHQLRQAQKMEAVGHLAGGVAHDFNNLLTVIKGCGEMVLDTFPPGDDRREELQEVVHAADRAADLTRQLLAFSRRQVLQPQVVDPRVSVHAVGGMLRRLLGVDITISVTDDGESGSVRVDPGQLEQVLVNLAVNARDAMPHGGRLTTHVGNQVVSPQMAAAMVGPDPVAPGEYVVVTVADTGLGMDAHTLAHAFDPFFTSKPAGKGTGLGLATVHGIVRQSGGYVAVESAPGQGTCFSLYLPRHHEVSAGRPVAPAPQPTPALRGRETVLLAEDEDVVRHLVRRMLEEQGYEVLAAANGLEALALAETRAPGAIHLLLSDVVMPGMSGPQLAREMKQRHTGVPVLFISGHTDDRLPTPDETTDLLMKPFAHIDLVRRTRAAIDAATHRPARPATEPASAAA